MILRSTNKFIPQKPPKSKSKLKKENLVKEDLKHFFYMSKAKESKHLV